MRHGRAYRHLGRNPTHRRALLRNMATSLLLVEKYETTIAKAREIRSVVERIITKAKKDSLHARREAFSYLMDKSAVHKLFAEIAPRYADRPGGYTRIIKSGRRHGDAAELAYIELIQEEYKPAGKKTKKGGSKRSTKTKAATETAATEASPA